MPGAMQYDTERGDAGPDKYVQFNYDLKQSPPTYDFLTWLTIIDRLRREDRADGMVVRIIPGYRYKAVRDTKIGFSQREWRTKQLLPELCKLLPSVKYVILGETGVQEQKFLSWPYPFDAILKAPEYVHEFLPFQGDFITLTVRQSWNQLDRDTDQKTWCNVIDKLPLPVVVVPDTEAEMMGQQCMIPWGRYYTPAAFSPLLRMALYEKAKLNLFTSGGPMMMAAYSNVNAEVFGLRVESVSACSAPYLVHCGLTDGLRVHNTVFHWNALPEQILGAVKQRLEC